MAPAEIWQGGNLINTIKGGISHTSELRGREVTVIDAVEDDDAQECFGCVLCEDHMTQKRYLHPGDSVTLDHGEIVKCIE